MQNDNEMRGFEFCVFVAGWRHGLRSEWPFIIIIINEMISDDDDDDDDRPKPRT